MSEKAPVWFAACGCGGMVFKVGVFVADCSKAKTGDIYTHCVQCGSSVVIAPSTVVAEVEKAAASHGARAGD